MKSRCQPAKLPQKPAGEQPPCLLPAVGGLSAILGELQPHKSSQPPSSHGVTCVPVFTQPFPSSRITVEACLLQYDLIVLSASAVTICPGLGDILRHGEGLQDTFLGPAQFNPQGEDTIHFHTQSFKN